ncbi:MAG: hypothetical protein H7Z75_10230 [Ferruginibacter sp.]|nr:hypothetical protein [Cytophagales bacterium]
MPQLHRQSQVHFKADQPLTLLGFYSAKAQGIFTHHDRHLHVHLTPDDNQRSGHVETVELTPGMGLLLPGNGMFSLGRKTNQLRPLSF